jgi:hypothetical protein
LKEFTDTERKELDETKVEMIRRLCPGEGEGGVDNPKMPEMFCTERFHYGREKCTRWLECFEDNVQRGG